MIRIGHKLTMNNQKEEMINATSSSTERIDNCSHYEKQHDTKMCFKWRDVQGLKVYINYGTKNCIEEDKRCMK